jgi:hypothetical protein
VAAERLGEILVREGACSEAAVLDALKNQVIFGGRLGTNLLEIQAVTEEALAKALGKQHGLPSLSGDLELDPAATSLLKPEIADRVEALPYVLSGRRLAVIVVDPRDLATLDEVAFATGKQVHPVVAPEARVWALLRRHYGVDRHLRGIDVDFAKVQGRIERNRGLAATPPAASGAGGDLMEEGAFDALYAGAPLGAAPPAPPSRPAVAPPAPPAAPVARPAAPPPPRPPAPAARAAPPPPPPPGDVVELTDLLLEPEPWIASDPPRVPPEVAAEVLAALSQGPGHAPPEQLAPAHAPEPEPSPLGFAEATRSLDGVNDRDAIARTVLRYARSKFRRALLLTVHRGAAHGWAGLGEKLGPEAVRRMRLALGTPGILETVVTTQAHFLGPIPKTDANIRLLKALGGGVPGNAFVVPILALGRVVNVFYADNGKGAVVDSGDVGELLILATRIAKSYDALLQRVR